MSSLIKAIGFAAALLFPLGAANASDRNYRIDANSQRTIALRLCGPEVTVLADGDDDTDLDFHLYNSAGRLIHRDLDGTDMMIKTVRRGDDCGNYRLVVTNLGDVFNRMDLSLQDA